MIRRIPLWLLSLLLVACTLGSGCSRGSGEAPKVNAITLTDRVDDRTKAPITPLARFPKDAKQLYASVQMTAPRQGTKLEARWLYDQSGSGNYLLIASSEVTFDKASRTRYAAFHLVATDTFPSGAYKIQILLDGQMAGETAFTVE